MSKIPAPQGNREPSAKPRDSAAGYGRGRGRSVLQDPAALLSAQRSPPPDLAGSGPLAQVLAPVLAQVQARLASPPPFRGSAGDRSALIHEAAARGIVGAGERLPYLQTIQRAFGRHELAGVQAHTGPAANEAARAMGAQAFAVGNHVAFAGTPDLRTAAHEAAHVVQQSGGLKLAGGVGQADDPHEQHAELVADRVVKGLSAEALLDGYAGSAHSGAVQQSVVQCSPVSDVVAGFAQVTSLSEIGRRGAEAAAPLIAQAKQEVEPLVGQAVADFLKSDSEVIKALRLAMVLKLAGQLSGDAGHTLVAQLEATCSALFRGRVEALRDEAAQALMSVLARLPDAPELPAIVQEFVDSLDAALVALSESAIVRHVQEATATFFAHARSMAGALLEGALGSMAGQGIQSGLKAIGSAAINGKQLASGAAQAASQAVTSSGAYQNATQILDAALARQQVITDKLAAAEKVIEAVEQEVINLIPEVVQSAIKQGGEWIFKGVSWLAQLLPERVQEAVQTIKPGLPGTAKRTGKYLGHALVGSEDHLGGAQKTLAGIQNSAMQTGQQATDKALAQAGEGLPNPQTVLRVLQATSAMAQAPADGTAGTVGEVATGLGLEALGGYVGASAASATPAALAAAAKLAGGYLGASSVIPSALAAAAASPMAPLVVGGAVAHAASSSETGQYLKGLGGTASEMLTQVPLVGLPWLKATQAVAHSAAQLNAGFQLILPSALGGSEEAARAANQHYIDVQKAFGERDWSWNNLLYGVQREEPDASELTPEQLRELRKSLGQFDPDLD